MNTRNDQGISLVEIMVSLAIASIIAVSILTVLSSAYQDRQNTRVLTSRIIDTAMMKQALNETVTSAGAIVTPTAISTSSATTQVNNFFGYNTWGNKASNTGGSSDLTSMALPTAPISSPSSSTVSFYWISDNDGGQELCQGTLQITGDVLRYIIQSDNLSTSGTSTCTPNGKPSEEADFLVGGGWSFQPTLQTGTGCLGPAFYPTKADALVAVKAPMAGTSATSSTSNTQVSVCLPNG